MDVTSLPSESLLRLHCVQVELARIKFFDNRILAVPPAVKIDLAAAIAAEGPELPGNWFVFEWLAADGAYHALNHRRNPSVVQPFTQLRQ